MSRIDLRKPFVQTGESLKKIAILNPVSIHKKGTRVKALFALALVSFFWGTTWLASKQGVKHMPALQLAGIRQFLGGLAYLLFFLGKGRVWPRGAEWGPILMLGLLNFVLSNGLSTWGLEYIPAGLGAILGAIFPLWLVVIGLFRGQSIPAKAILGIILGFAGICIIFYEHLSDFLDSRFRFGLLISVAATWTWAFGTLYTKKKAASFNPYFSIGLQMLISGIVLYSIALVSGRSIPVAEIPWQSWAAVGYLVLFGSVLSFVAYLFALQNLPTEQASIYAYVNPIVATVLAALLFDEKFTVFIVLGGIVTLSGVYLVNQVYRHTDKQKAE